MTRTRAEWDYIVVGAGSAGCTVSNRLSEPPHSRVLLIEAGPPAPAALRFLAAARYLDLSRFDWGYSSQPDPTRNQKTERWLRGRCTGGSSSINGTNHVRGCHADYDRWAALGNHGWSSKDVMPYFRAIECCERGFGRDVDYSTRGRCGPLHIREVRSCHPLTEAFMRAAVSAGLQHNPDYNGTCQEGVGYAQLTQIRGFRCSAADAFLKPALRRANLHLITDSSVRTLLIDRDRVLGVRYEKDGRIEEAYGAQVILCAGAINSPALLMHSGIGEATALKQLGIEPVLDQPAVGRNLLEHPLIRLVFRANISTYNPGAGLAHAVRMLGKFFIQGQGPLASVVEAQGFLRTSSTLPAADIQLHFMPVGMGYAIDNPYHVLRYPSATILINKSHPESRGHLRLASADPRRPPVIEPRMLADDRDLHTLVKGVQAVRRILEHQPIKNFITEESRPGAECKDAADIAAYVRQNTEGAYHPAGTCRMGTGPDAVVSPDLRVKGMQNLWVADASIMPDLISGNINAACIMIGHKLADALSRGSSQAVSTPSELESIGI